MLPRYFRYSAAAAGNASETANAAEGGSPLSPLRSLPLLRNNKNVDRVPQSRAVDTAAAQLELWALRFGRSSVAAVAMALGSLCRRFGVDVADAVTVVQHAYRGSIDGQN